MKLLSSEEMNSVSGAYAWNSVTDVVVNIGEAAVSATLGASMGFIWGAIIGGKHGGDGGGLLGVGSIGQGVGMIAGGIIGAVTCGIGATIVGYDVTLSYSEKAFDAMLDGTFVP